MQKNALGDKADYLKIGIVYPLPEKKIKEFASKYDKVFVIEERTLLSKISVRASG